MKRSALGWNMNKSAWLICLLCFLICCSPKTDKVERIIEDGVKIVINPLELYGSEASSSVLKLEKEFSIDTENDELAKLGFSNVFDFVIDSDASIICVYEQWAPEYYLFKFDKNGNFVTRFGKKGQAPGELTWVGRTSINEQNDVFIIDMGTRKLLVFSNNGEFQRDIPLSSNISRITPLDNGKYIILRSIVGPEVEKRILSLCDSKFKKLKQLDSIVESDRRTAEKIRGIRYYIYYSVSKKHIFVGNTKRDYEFWVFDLEGNLVRKIRKEYKRVDIPEEFIKHTLETYSEERKDRAYFPKNFPPYRFFFADDEGRLFVMTYEKNRDSNEYIYDIFNTDGVFIDRIGLRNFGRGSSISKIEWTFQTKAKKNHLYCIQEKENGYKELVVYKMNWQ